MAAPVYATLDDLAQWLDDDLPIGALAVLRTAAYAVADRISLSAYRLDDSGNPADLNIVAGLRDATCAQAAFLIANEIDVHGGGASAGVEKSVKIGSASVEYADASGAAGARAAGISGLCDIAERIIQRLGLRVQLTDYRPYWGF